MFFDTQDEPNSNPADAQRVEKDYCIGAREQSKRFACECYLKCVCVWTWKLMSSMKTKPINDQ